MCPVKTENLSRNVARAEGTFWRELVTEMRAKSRGHLENFLLAEGLKAVNRRAAKRLLAIRELASGRQLLAVVGRHDLRRVNGANRSAIHLIFREGLVTG